MAVKKSASARPKSKNSLARAKKYTPQTAALILAKLADGATVPQACASAGVDSATWYRWLILDDVLCEEYARAKTLMADAMAEEILQIADNESGDLLQGKDGPYGNRAAVDRSRLRVDSRKWLLSKLMPKKYGDKLDVSAEKGAFNLTLNFDEEDKNA